jgi:solute carrier family 35, member E3
LIIGKTSPITYNVIGHLKSCLIILGGFVIFKYPPQEKQIVGIALTLVGIFWYTYLKNKPQKTPPPKGAQEENKMEEK